LPFPIQNLAFLPDGRTLVTGSDKRLLGFGRLFSLFISDRSLTRGIEDHVRFWDLVSGTPSPKQVKEKTVVPHPRVAVSSDGGFVASGAGDGTVWVWDQATRQQRHILFVGRDSKKSHIHAQSIIQLGWFGGRLSKERGMDGISALAFAPDGRTLAAANNQNVIKLFEPATGRERATLEGDRLEVACLAFSPDSSLLATNFRNQVQLYNVGTARLFQTLPGHKDDVRAVAFSPEGTILATGAKDFRVKVWDLKTGLEKATLGGHTDTVTSLAFAPDGKTLASASLDGTIRLWNLALFQDVLVLEGHTGNINSIAFSKDGSLLASGGDTPQGAGEVLIWRAPLATKEN
jgi:WD40 repeat protein